MLAAIAGQTERIRLGTGVTVLSSDDPIRVYERFATLDAVSNGRAEVQLGRGSFIESFGLFGLDLGDYDRLFEEKLDLFAALQHEQPVTWEGSIRTPLVDQPVYPTTAAGKVPAWIGVGGTPQSVVRAARYGMPLMLAVIGGSPAAFVQFADLYRDALGQLDLPELPIGMHSPGHVAATDEEAREQLYPHQAELFTRIGRERGWGPYSRIPSSRRAAPQGALFVGSPETVAQKIAWAARTLGLSRFQLKYSVGALPHEQRLESVRLYGEEVIPRVRELHGRLPRLVDMRTFIQRSLWDVVPRDQRDSAEAFRRRQVVAAIVVLVGAGVLGLVAAPRAGRQHRSTSRPSCWPGSGRPARSCPAGSTWAGWRAATRSSSARSWRRSCSACCWSGSSSLGSLVVREIPPLADYVSSVLEYADEGSLTAAGGHHVLQRHRRGAVLPRRDVRRDPEAPGALDDAGLRRRDPGHRQRDARPSPRSCSARCAASSGGPAAASSRRS